MSTPLRSARSIQQKLLSSKEGIRSVLSYNTYRKDDPICSDKELERKLKQLDRELGRLLEYVKRIEDKTRRDLREQKVKEQENR